MIKSILKYSILLFSITVLITSNSCKKSTTSSGNGLESDFTATEVVEKFISLVNVSTSSIVTFVGPVEPGTKIMEQNLGDTTAVEIIFPSTNGTYYAFIIDNEPNMMFAHDMDYAWIDMDTETVGSNTDVYWPGLIVRPGVNPSPFTILETFDVNGVQFSHASGEGSPTGEDNSHKSEPDALSKIPVHAFDIQREPRKLAFVIDAGERSGSDRLYDLHTNPMATWVEGEGFEVIHTSQDASNTLRRYASPNSLTSNITAAGAYFTNLGEPECGCDEFFLYITGHGTRGGHSGIGLVNGNVSQLIRYQDIYDAISNSFPSYVKVTLLFDSCFSGRAISVFPNTINNLCSNLCAVTVLASCKSTVSTGAPVYGSGVIVSGTQMFTAGANLDHDGDGRRGDLKDRFAEMQGRQTTLESQSFHCPEGGSWCSLDATPPPEEIAKCTGVEHGSTSSVIKVCIKYCNVPDGATVDIELSGPSSGTATVEVIGGEACVEFPINWYGEYAWTAMLNPGSVQSEGSITVTSDDVSCTY